MEGEEKEKHIKLEEEEAKGGLKKVEVRGGRRRGGQSRSCLLPLGSLKQECNTLRLTRFISHAYIQKPEPRRLSIIQIDTTRDI